MNLTTLWLRGFALTMLLEAPIAIPLLGAVEPSKLRRMMAVLVANLATHPLVWFFFFRLGWARPLATVVAEAWAFGFEVLVYRTIFARATWGRCAAVSAVANLISYSLGVLAAPLGLFG